MEKPLNKRQLQHQKTLQTIRTAIDELVEEKGFDAMTIRDICERSGIKIGTFYYYFKSKNDILEDRYRRTADYFHTLYEEKLQYMETVEALKEFTREFIQYSANRIEPIFKKFYQVMIEEYISWKKNYSISTEDIVYKIISQGQSEGTIRQDINADMFSFMYFSCLDGLNIHALAKNRYIYQEDELFILLDDMIKVLIDK